MVKNSFSKEDDFNQWEKLISIYGFKRFDKKLRMAPEPDSVQNELRYELIKNAWERMNEGWETKHYLEVVCLCDSLMTDRFARILQVLMEISQRFNKNDPKEYPLSTLKETIHNLTHQMHLDKRSFGEDFEKHLDCIAYEGENKISNWRKIKDKKERANLETGNWVRMRNVCVHEFVTVHEVSVHRKLKERHAFEKTAAKVGMLLTKETFRHSNIILKGLREDINYGK